MALTDKTTKLYDYTSRYSSFPYYYNTKDHKYVYGITGYLYEDTESTRHDIEDGDTLDSLAMKYYGRPDLYWVIADFNRIQDPWINIQEYYNYLYIPTLSGIRFE